MPQSNKDFLTSLTASEMKRLLVARERIDVLETEKAKLTSALEKIDNELARLLDDGSGTSKPGRKKAGRKKAGRKKAAKKKVTKKVKKKVTKKAAKKVVKKVAKKKVAKKAGKKVTKTRTAKKSVTRKSSQAASTGRVKLEDVVVEVLKKGGGTLSFKELIETIVKKKLFTTKSSNFDNVLRRTLSTSTLVKRAGRGVYTVA